MKFFFIKIFIILLIYTNFIYTNYSKGVSKGCDKQLLTKKTGLKESILSPNAPIAVLFCHGIGGSSEQVMFYRRYLNLPLKIFAIDFPCSTKYTSFPNLKTCFAQEKEQEVIIKKYLELVKNGYKVLLFGVSNGASSIITTAGCYELKNCVGIIAESAYDDPKIIINKLFGRVTKFLMSAQGLSSGYNFSGICPIQVIDRIDKNIPLLFICSNKDKLILASQTENLNRKAIKAGITSSLLKLSYGEHANLLVGPEGQKYRDAVISWVKKNGLINKHSK